MNLFILFPIKLKLSNNCMTAKLRKKNNQFKVGCKMLQIIFQELYN